LLVNYRSNHV